MLRVLFFWTGGQEMERMIMGNAAVIGELAGADELEELFELDASESEPEDDEDDDEFEGEEDDEDKGLDPEEIPHG
jgi:hypothetical protein